MRGLLPAVAVVAGLALASADAYAARGSADGVSITVDRRAGAKVRALRPERRRIVQRGGAATVTCGFRSALFPAVQLDTERVVWPRGRSSITIRTLRRDYEYCSVEVQARGARERTELAAVPFSAAGRVLIDERNTTAVVVANLQKVLITSAELRGGRYPNPEELRSVNYQPLASPGDLPSPGEVGVYSSETDRRLRVVTLTRAGAAIYVELDRDEFRTNAPHWVASFLRG